MLHQRLIFGTLLLAGFVGLFWLDARLEVGLSPPAADAGLSAKCAVALRHGFIMTCICALMAAVATRELVQLARAREHRPSLKWATTAVTVFIFFPWARLHFAPHWRPEGEYLLLLVVLAAIGSFVSITRRQRIELAAVDVALTLFSITYVGLLGSYLPRMRLEAATPWLLIYVLLTVKSCDIGAYFTGLAVGRRKLIPWLSPKKTVEGLIGGVATSMAVAAGLSALFDWTVGAGSGAAPAVGFGGGSFGGGSVLVERGSAAGMDLVAASPVWPDWPRALAFGALMAIVGQAGDLFESLLKRDAGAKDSAVLVPAFGGVLDLLDSLLLCVPVAYWVLLRA